MTRNSSYTCSMQWFWHCQTYSYLDGHKALFESIVNVVAAINFVKGFVKDSLSSFYPEEFTPNRVLLSVYSSVRMYVRTYARPCGKTFDFR